MGSIFRKSLTALVTLVFFQLTASLHAQVFEPSVVILEPGTVKIDKSFHREVDDLNAEMKKSVAEQLAKKDQQIEESADRTANVTEMLRASRAFNETIDFNTLICDASAEFMTYYLFQRYKFCRVFAVHTKSTESIDELEKIAGQNKAQFVVFFPQLDFRKVSGKPELKVRVKLYDNLSKRFIYDEEITGDAENQGLEFTCTDELLCTINNSISAYIRPALKLITKYSTITLHEELVHRKRAQVIDSLAKHPDPSVLPVIHAQNAQESGYRFGFMSAGKDRFVAFYQGGATAESHKKDVKEGGHVYLDQLSNTSERSGENAYTLIGILFDNQWYLQKERAQWLDKSEGESLMSYAAYILDKYEYFIPNDTLKNPAFWSTGFFSVVPDLKQDPKWKRYGTGIWLEDEVANRPYLGMPEMIVKRKIEALEERKKLLSDSLLKAVFLPKYELLKKTDPQSFSAFEPVSKNEQITIGNLDLSAIINPVVVTDATGRKSIRFYVALKGDPATYEWVFKPLPVEPVKSGYYTSELIDYMERYTAWNFGTVTLNDQAFWQDLVLKKENGTFYFLKKL